MFEARVRAEVLKELVAIVSTLVDEVKVKATPEGLSLKAVDPAHVAMVEATLNKGAFEEYKVEEDTDLGIDIDKLKDAIGLARSGDEIILHLDSERNRLVLYIGNLTRAMPLIDTTGMPDPKVPKLDLPTRIVVQAQEVAQGIKASKSVADHIELSANPDQFQLRCEGDNQNLVDLKLEKSKLDELVCPEPVKSLFSLDYFSQMVGALKGDRLLTLSLGNDFPVLIEFEIADNDLTGPQGHTKYLLAPRIDHDT